MMLQPHGGGGGIHPKRMDVGAISGHQGPAVMKEAAQLGGVDGNVSTILRRVLIQCILIFY